ncbi:MAG: holo-ACP synthase [Alphaproteobacteria bacterium]|nr:holo-ACP synthase [Alphaproteobacteria bacterium]
MIIGLGSDIVNIQRMVDLIKRHPQRAFNKILSKKEHSDLSLIKKEDLIKQATFLAKRFAAKEACVKALGTGFRNGIKFSDIIVSHDPLGKPLLILENKAKLFLDEKINKGFRPQIDITLSDDFPIAQAIVIFSIVKN